MWWATSFHEIRQGTSQNHLEEAFVRRLLLALPRRIFPILLADRGFGRVNFLLFLQGLGQALGRWAGFVIRLPGKLTVEHERRAEWPRWNG